MSTVTRTEHPDDWTTVAVAHMSITLTGRSHHGMEPLAITFTDKPQPGSLDSFGLVERAGFRALALAIIAEIDDEEFPAGGLGG